MEWSELSSFSVGECSLGSCFLNGPREFGGLPLLYQIRFPCALWPRMRWKGRIWLSTAAKTKKTERWALPTFFISRIRIEGIYETPIILLQTLYQGIDFAPLLKLLEAIFELLVPMVIAGIVDQSLPQRNQGHLWMQIGLLLIFAVIGVVVAW